MKNGKDGQKELIEGKNAVGRQRKKAILDETSMKLPTVLLVSEVGVGGKKKGVGGQKGARKNCFTLAFC